MAKNTTNGRSQQDNFGPADLDTVDRDMLRELTADGRLPNSEIARRVGVSETTVRNRLERMIDHGVLAVRPVLNAARTGYPVDIIINIKVKDGRILEVAERLKAMEHVAYVGIVTGSFDLIAEAFLRDGEHLRDFLVHELAGLDGIATTETFTVLSTEKFTYTWEIPGEARDPRRRRSPRPI